MQALKYTNSVTYQQAHGGHEDELLQHHHNRSSGEYDRLELMLYVDSKMESLSQAKDKQQYPNHDPISLAELHEKTLPPKVTAQIKQDILSMKKKRLPS